MPDENQLQQIQNILNSELSQEEMEKKIDEVLPAGCNRTVEKEESYSEECNARTGNPYRYRHCVTITGCSDPGQNMPRTCGQWRCY